MTKKEALKEAKKLGLNSIHEMRNGEFMPGSTHQQYESWINDPLKSVYSKLRTLEPTEFIQGSNQSNDFFSSSVENEDIVNINH